MKLSFLIQLMLMLILVVSVYLIFTNSIQGRTKLIVIIISLIIGLYLFFKIPYLRDFNEKLSSPVSARQSYIIDSDDMKKNDGEYSFSSWIYIDDWNYKNGLKKHILYHTNNTAAYTKSGDSETDEARFDINQDDDEDLNISMYLDENKNDLHIMLNIRSIEESSVKEKITIENINLQKWVNVIFTVNNRTIDVYINGKLVKTKTFENLIEVPEFSKNHLFITPYDKDGQDSPGFGGYISKVRFYPYFVSPRQAWNIYYNGFGDILESSLNKYGMHLTFLEDNKETNKYILY